MPTPLILMAALAGLILGISIPLIIKAVRQTKRLQEEGYEVDAIVIASESQLADTASGRRHANTVRYKALDGKEYEAHLSYAGAMPVGRKLRIKYLPEDTGYVLFVSQNLNTP